MRLNAAHIPFPSIRDTSLFPALLLQSIRHFPVQIRFANKSECRHSFVAIRPRVEEAIANHGGWGLATIFDLTQNPFNLLDVSNRANREKVVEAHENAVSEGRADETVLMRALQAVLTPRSRTEVELSWLPRLSPSAARAILSKLQSARYAELKRELKGLHGLDRANLAADLCIRLLGHVEYASELLVSYKEFSLQEVNELLVSTRSVSGFPLPDDEQVGRALAKLKEIHAKAAAACICATGAPEAALIELDARFYASGSQDSDHLLALIVREYDAHSETRLGMVREKIESAIQRNRDGSDPVPVDILIELLAEWHKISRPVQMFEGRKGLEEVRSKRLCEFIREYCLWLANHEGQHEFALLISQALLSTFYELPAISVQLADDLNTLAPLAEEEKSLKLLKPLLEAIAASQAALDAFDADLVLSGFGPKSRGHAGRLYDAFVEVATRLKGSENAKMPWILVRGIAIGLYNDHASLEGANAILAALIQPPSRGVVAGMAQGVELA